MCNCSQSDVGGCETCRESQKSISKKAMAIAAFKQALIDGKFSFTWRGHHRSRYHAYLKFPTENNFEFLKNYGLELAAASCAVEAITDSNADQIIAILNAQPGSIALGKCPATCSCFECGDDIEIVLGSNTIAAVGRRCKYAGVSTPSIDINFSIPSGKIVFTSSFEGATPPKRTGFGIPGFINETKHYAKQNIMFGACGISHLSIWINEKKSSIVIAKDGHRDQWEQDKLNGFKVIGVVPTEGRAWSAACSDTAKWFDGTVARAKANVIPGRYRLRQEYHRFVSDDGFVSANAAAVVATIDRIGR